LALTGFGVGGWLCAAAAAHVSMDAELLTMVNQVQ
jgi:hypothetical protein